MDFFKGLIDQELARFEERLDFVLAADVELVHEIARYMATLRGKRLRPALALLSAKAFGELHCFIDDHSPRDIGSKVELKRPYPKYGPFYRIDLVDRTIEQRYELRVEGLKFLGDRVQQFLEEPDVSCAHVLFRKELCFDVRG